MLKIILNYDFLEALIFKNHENHEKANKIVTAIRKDDYLYIPCHVLIAIMKKLGNYDYESNIRFLENINLTTRIDYVINKPIFSSANELFKSNDSFSFLDCITIQYMNYKQFKYIISFDEKFDEINSIKRLYKIDEYHPHSLNFFN